jgi:hypothetical protein
LRSEIDNANTFHAYKMFEQLFGVKNPVTAYKSDKYGVQYFNLLHTDYEPHRQLENFFDDNPKLEEGLKYQRDRGFAIPGLPN